MARWGGATRPLLVSGRGLRRSGRGGLRADDAFAFFDGVEAVGQEGGDSLLRARGPADLHLLCTLVLTHAEVLPEVVLRQVPAAPPSFVLLHQVPWGDGDPRVQRKP